MFHANQHRFHPEQKRAALSRAIWTNRTTSSRNSFRTEAPRLARERGTPMPLPANCTADPWYKRPTRYLAWRDVVKRAGWPGWPGLAWVPSISDSLLSWRLIAALRPWIRAAPTVGAAAAGRTEGPAGALGEGAGYRCASRFGREAESGIGWIPGQCPESHPA